VDDQAVYITNNMFAYDAAGGGFGGVRLWIIDKGTTGGFYDGGVVSATVPDPYGGAGIAITTMPSHMFGSPPTGVGTFLISYSGLTDGTNEFLQIVRVDLPLGVPALTQQYVSIGNLEDFASFPDAPQSGSSFGIETNDRRALHAVWFDDMLWVVATTVPKAGDADAGETTAHWWRLATSMLSNVIVSDQGGIGGEDIASGTYTYFPSVAVNGAGQTVFGFSASAPSIYAGSYYTTRQVGDPGGSTSGSATLRAGTDYYERTFCGSRNRWGDYSGAAVDPTDGGFWIYNKHASSRGSGSGSCINNDSDEDGRWSTAYGENGDGGI